MLAGAGFGDDAFLAEALGEQDLAERVVDLVRAGVQQVLALQVDLRAAEQLGPALREIERRRPADVVVEQVVEFRLEGRIVSRGFVGGGEFLQRSHQRFRHEHAAEAAEVAGGIGNDGWSGAGDMGGRFGAGFGRIKGGMGSRNHARNVAGNSNARPPFAHPCVEHHPHREREAEKRDLQQ